MYLARGMDWHENTAGRYLNLSGGGADEATAAAVSKERVLTRAVVLFDKAQVFIIS